MSEDTERLSREIGSCLRREDRILEMISGSRGSPDVVDGIRFRVTGFELQRTFMRWRDLHLKRSSHPERTTEQTQNLLRWASQCDRAWKYIDPDKAYLLTEREFDRWLIGADDDELEKGYVALGG